MELANFVTKLQDVLRPKQEEIETSNYQKGKRIMLPAKDVGRVYRYQRKQVVRVTYTGPTKNRLSVLRHSLFIALRCRSRYPEYHSDVCKQKAYWERKKAAA